MRTEYLWKRFFARIMDLFLYMLMFHVYMYLVLGRNIYSWLSRADWNAVNGRLFLDLSFISDKRFLSWGIENILAVFFMMIILEPIMLRLFCATPGKMLLGIKVKDQNGSNLSI